EAAEGLEGKHELIVESEIDHDGGLRQSDRPFQESGLLTHRDPRHVRLELAPDRSNASRRYRKLHRDRVRGPNNFKSGWIGGAGGEGGRAGGRYRKLHRERVRGPNNFKSGWIGGAREGEEKMIDFIGGDVRVWRHRDVKLDETDCGPLDHWFRPFKVGD